MCAVYKYIYIVHTAVDIDISHVHVPCRPYWRCYYANTDAIIYVVDSADRDRLAISKSELVSMLEVSDMSGGWLLLL